MSPARTAPTDEDAQGGFDHQMPPRRMPPLPGTLIQTGTDSYRLRATENEYRSAGRS
ncbi:hypothetical protein I2W78_02130 [Streptomyces spinoverrucosus]|uniref:hypothetical protein n=1 Tax=Streptomyces spinoverrucosus TaxID=284043 RepID=UPI0018C4314F|nr:hypothetical protein [Streptomyces spinoverrucosus]MBG0850682.1 hypothetical protein [Streptomyces spinoverrucosus]